MAKQSFSYQKSIEELQKILEEIESGEVRIDDLAKKVKRGKELVALCQDKLRTTEEDIREMLA
ncbi:MAG: exodeoxyribonuclease VII small subunit [Bacteroidota bacterium]